MNWFLRRLVSWWVRFKVRPEEAAALLRGRGHPLVYVLERRSVADLAVLQAACKQLKLPRPGQPLFPGSRELRSYLFLTQLRGFGGGRLDRRPPPHLARMIRVLREDPQADFELVAAAVYWGR